MYAMVQLTSVSRQRFGDGCSPENSQEKGPTIAITIPDEVGKISVH